MGRMRNICQNMAYEGIWSRGSEGNHNSRQGLLLTHHITLLRACDKKIVCKSARTTWITTGRCVRCVPCIDRNQSIPERDPHHSRQKLFPGSFFWLHRFIRFSLKLSNETNADFCRQNSRRFFVSPTFSATIFETFAQDMDRRAVTIRRSTSFKHSPSDEAVKMANPKRDELGTIKRDETANRMVSSGSGKSPHLQHMFSCLSEVMMEISSPRNPLQLACFLKIEGFVGCTEVDWSISLISPGTKSFVQEASIALPKSL